MDEYNTDTLTLVFRDGSDEGHVIEWTMGDIESRGWPISMHTGEEMEYVGWRA